jgi:L-lactate dehydrogenase complex protein LldG
MSMDLKSIQPSANAAWRETDSKGTNLVSSMVDQSANTARTEMLQSIRWHLAESVVHDKNHSTSTLSPDTISENGEKNISIDSPVAMFRHQLESVGGHCIVVKGEEETAQVLNRILAELESSLQKSPRIALSDAPLLSRLAGGMEVGEITTSPSADDLFTYDVGITTAQAAIAETGTLVLESDQERHRLVSLLPPVHIAVVNAADVCATLGEALRLVRRNGSEMSRAITFITGPSRTADIELTLTIGVHGPKELYVIVDEGMPMILL